MLCLHFIQNITSRKITESFELKTALKRYDKLIGIAFPRITYIIIYLPHVRAGAANGLLQLSDILDT
jgi:hypothetical protein